MKTKTLIEELQDIALHKDSSILEILRLALYVSRKLKQKDFEKWVDSELNGYSEEVEVPEYRKIPCQLKGLNHIRREWQPVSFESIVHSELYSVTPIKQAIGELEKLAISVSSRNGMLTVRLPAITEKQLLEGLHPSVIPQEIALHIDTQHVMGIVDKVKSLVLKWALDLEDAGIMGEGRQFTEKEKETAKSFSISYHNCHVEAQAIGQNMENSQIMQASRGATQILEKADISELIEEIVQEIGTLSLSEGQKLEVEAELETLRAQVKSPIPKKGIIKEALVSIRNIFEGALGGVGSSLLLKMVGIIQSLG